MNTGTTKTIHQVFAVFKLIDDFTGKTITDSITAFFVNNQRISPIRKADGIYVLTNLQIDRATISIQSANYCPYFIDSFVPSCGVETSRIITIRLHPGVNYPIKTGTTAYSAEFINASGEPIIGTNIKLFVPFCNNAVKFKAFKTINTINAINITNPKGLDFTGLTLTVPTSKPLCPIIFTIINKIDNMTFEIDKLLENPPPLEESIVKRVYSSITNNQGQVLIPLDTNLSLSSSRNSEEVAVELYAGGSEHNAKNEKISKKVFYKEIMIKPGSLKHFKEKIDI